MILSGTKLKELFTSNVWQCNKNPQLLHYNPNSIDVTLSPYFYVNKDNSEVLDPFTSNPDDYYQLVETDELILNPQQFILASVNEAFNTINPVNGHYYTQIYDGRSTIARLGLLTHISAGYGDYGFNGAFTLEIVNNSPFKIKLHANMRIGQIYFESLDNKAIDMVYQGYIQLDGKPALPRLGKERF